MRCRNVAKSFEVITIPRAALGVRFLIHYNHTTARARFTVEGFMVVLNITVYCSFLHGYEDRRM